MFHVPAHKNTDHPAGQYREQHPSRQVDEDSKPYPTGGREPKPRFRDSSTVGDWTDPEFGLTVFPED